ncbi:MAG: hypothetical protein K8R35_03925 [Bacteroidales bacterium]|nr:hypothetical protein [Bacteroidales bacterium]
MIKRFCKVRKWPVIVILLALITLVSCEQDLDLIDPVTAGTWEEFSSLNGLAGDKIRDIKSDSKGNLWFACYGSGVAMYDGSSWITYNTSNSGILSNYITCIEEDHDGDMWFGTTNGISFLVDGTDWLYLQDPVTQYYINSIKRDNTGWVWAGTNGTGYIVYDYTGFYFSSLAPVPELNVVNIIEEDASGNIWLGTDLGILKWDWSQWNWISSNDGLPDNEIWSLFPDSKGRMWIGTAGGSTVSYYANNSIENISLFNGQSAIYITDIFEDHRGDIWFATWFDGLIKYDGVIAESFKEYNGFLEDDVEALAEDENGDLWIGTYSKGAVRYRLPLNFK